MFYVYILKCNDGTLYCGYAAELIARVKVHNDGKGAKYTKGRLPVEIVFWESFYSKSQAMKREIEIKKLTRENKMKLINTMNEKEEDIKVLFENAKMRVEEISSNGVVSPENHWYSNPIPEWVRIMLGDAVLELENSEVILKNGDSYYIESNVKHRVKYTSNDCKWLCVYIKI